MPPPPVPRFPRTESAFHQNLTKEDRAELLTLQTLREIPKSRYATQSCITGLPSGRNRKVVYSHVEVYKMVEAIATELREAGVRPQTVCAFILRNAIESIVYFQALEWIGAIAVPIDPDFSQDEIALLLDKTQAFTVVSPLVHEDDQDEDELFQKVRAACAGKNIIEWYVSRSTNRGVFMERMDRRAGEGAAWAGGASDFKYDPSETALRLASLYGENCLVVDMSHRSVASAVREFSNTYNLTAEMSTLLVFPIHDMQGLMCALATMYSGGNIMVKEGAALEADSIARIGAEYEFHWFSADADTVLDVYNYISNDQAVWPTSLSFIRSVNGRTDGDTLRKIEPVLRTPVLEAYGTSETCVLVSANQDMDFRPGTCGRAVNGCDIVILDDKGQKQPAGEDGSIAVYGLHVCRGFNDNEFANEKCFIEVGEGADAKRYFLTGDKGCLTTDGYLKVTSAWLSRGRAEKLVAEEEEAIKSIMELEASRALQLAEEQRKKAEAALTAERENRHLEEERIKQEMETRLQKEADEARQRKEEEERHRQEEEERRLQDEQKSRDSARQEGDDDTDMDSDNTDMIYTPNSDDEEETASQNQTEAGVSSVSASVGISASTDGISQDLLQKILERLDRIERNQRRLEEDIEAGHRLEMERIRALVERSEQNSCNATVPANVDMCAINSAVTSAAESAQRSSQNTAAAAAAAKEAAAAAAEAAARQTETGVVTVTDPNAVQKRVVVSLEEVEQAMKLHPSVETARAFGRPDKRYGMEVFCAINPKTGARVSEPWLKLHAQTALPPAFVPKKFFYKADLKEDEDRVALAGDMDLKRMSHYSGFSSSKVVKKPEWSKEVAIEEQQKAMERIARLQGEIDDTVDEDPARTLQAGVGSAKV